MGFFFHHLRGETKKVIIRLPLGSFRRFQLKSMNYSGDGSEIKLSQNKAVSNSKAVTPTAHEVTLVAGDSSNVMSAAEGQGSGTWLSAFGGIEKVEVDGESVDKNTAITLTVPGATPKDAVQYKTVLTWTIADLPSV